MSPRWIDPLAQACVNGRVQMGKERTETLETRKMNMMKKCGNLIKALVLVCVSAWGVSAGHAAITSYSIADGGSEAFKLTWDTHTGVAFAGALSFTKLSGPGPNSFMTVCTDIGAT